MSHVQIKSILPQPMKLGECPVWDSSEAALYWIDIPGTALHRWSERSGMHKTWPLPSEPGCIALCNDGTLMIAMRGGLACFDPATGSLEAPADAPYDTATMRFNDGRCDASGRLWVGTLYDPRDQVIAPLFCIEKGNVRDTGKRATVSNGVAFSPDSKVLYHSDTTSHRIFAYEFDIRNGVVGDGRLFQQFSTDKTANYGGRPDGAAVDSEGAYWCAMFEGGRILRFSAAGELLQEIPVPARCPTMIAFGSDDLKTLYITTASHNRPPEELARYPLSGQVLSLRVDVAGLPEHRYQKT
ncbi:MAG: putative gluconolactonase with senescence marker [Paucimonas sp.]|jgi:sugar lactone lactonase YvrE|nr:putative gluconolactonase with senescence marker [Paucimonas sp.]